jgi:hypothetical protein
MVDVHGRTESWPARGAWHAGLVLALPVCLVGLLLLLGFNINLAVAGLAALVLLVLMFLFPAMTTLVVLFVLYANLPVVAINTYGVPELVSASFFLLLILPLTYYVMIARQPLVFNRTLIVMAVYLSVIFLSAVASGNVLGSLDRVLSYILEGLVLYILVINTVRTPSLLRNAMWALILAGMLMGSISLYQELTGSYANDFGGLAVVKDSGVMDTGRVDLTGNDVKRLRLSGPLGSKNRYAQVMVVLLPIALMRIWGERSKFLRVVAAVACIPIVGGALLTFSRGAGISIILALIAMLVLRVFRLRHLFVVGLVGMLFVATVIPDYIYRLSTTTDVAELASGNVQDASGSVRGRATVNLAALNIFLDHPLLGVGPGQTSSYMIEYGNEIGFRRLETDRRAHNMYLEELADTGIIGFAVFMSILGLTLLELMRVRRAWQHSRPDIAYLMVGLIVAIIAYMSTAVFLHLSYVRYYWVILALAGAATQIYGEGIVPKLSLAPQGVPGMAPRLSHPALGRESREA